MFYALTFIALVFAAFALIQSIKAEKRAHQNRLDAIRKQIEANEKKKFRKQLESRQKKRKPD
ncbi:hypothetical protein FLL45_09670 [Aliikangiella marina]|uniref:Uncharacterized protein n=1 Tax=Aliikangiella marina TaxID=1712262 RepID=A0A545TD98_9GAMM|nr:hypothetical protein [Aliikangiella marina]TQV75197.1 hypothetical protein FLL45_09670 [Aliikangiella marina]